MSAAKPQRNAYSDPEAVFRAANRKLLRTLSLATGDAEEAADVVQEAFVQLCLNWNKVQFYDDPVAWVRRVAVRRFYNSRRSLRRRTVALLRIGSQTRATSPEISPGDELGLMAALEKLPPQQRLAASLFYLDGLDTSETAQTMGISVGAVKQHLHRARQALRSVVEEQ